MNRQTAKDFSNDLMNLIRRSNSEEGCLLVTSEEGNVVVLSETQYEHLMITLEFLATTEFFPQVEQGSREVEETYFQLEAHEPDLFDLCTPEAMPQASFAS